MVVPVCRVHSVGEVSAWGNQFLGALQMANVIEVTFEKSVERFCQDPAPGTAIPIAFVENSPDSRKWITAIRESHRRVFLLWYGRGFSKEDLRFACENRVYVVFENVRPDDKAVITGIRRVADAAGLQQETEQIIHSIKATLLQGESAEAIGEMIQEIKIAVGKLERGVHTNEFVSQATGIPAAAVTGESKIPFYRQQDFGDALATVHDLERTGILSVKAALPGQQGFVYFLQGKIVGAVVGQVRGLKAIYRMFLWDDPQFSFAKRDPDDLDVQEHLTLAVKYIRVEGESLRQRFNGLRRELPPGDLKLELEPNSLHAGVRLIPEDFSTLSSVVEFGYVSRVVDYNPLPDVAIYEALIRLKRNQMIRVSVPPARSSAAA